MFPDRHTRSGFELQMRNTELREPKPLWWAEANLLFPSEGEGVMITLDGEHAALFSGGRLPWFQGCSLHKQPWKDSPVQRSSVPLLRKTCRNERLMGKCLPTGNWGTWPLGPVQVYSVWPVSEEWFLHCERVETKPKTECGIPGLEFSCGKFLLFLLIS